MEDAFRDLSAEILTLLKGDEVLLLNFDGEDSYFVRFNRNAIRQAGHVHQRRLQLTLIDGRHQAAAAFQLCGQRTQDLEQARAGLDLVGGMRVGSGTRTGFRRLHERALLDRSL